MMPGWHGRELKGINGEPKVTLTQLLRAIGGNGKATRAQGDQSGSLIHPGTVFSGSQEELNAYLMTASKGLPWPRMTVGVLAILAAYAPLFPELVLEWATFPNLSHGFAVPLIAGYLVWIRRLEITSATAAPSWLWLPLLSTGLALYVAGVRGGESFLARVSLPITLMGGVALISGWRLARNMVAGITYLFFMIPPPYLPLKDLTDHVRLFDATVTAAILPWFGVPVFQEGYFLHLPNMTLEVAAVCSSIPAIAAFLALAVAYSIVKRRQPTVQAILILSAVPFGILSNIIRITTTAAGVYLIGPIAIQNRIHMWNGTTVFLMTLSFLIALDAVLRRIQPGGA